MRTEKEIIQEISNKLYEIKDLMKELGEMGYRAYSAGISIWSRRDVTEVSQRIVCAELAFSNGLAEFAEAIGVTAEQEDNRRDAIFDGVGLYQLADRNPKAYTFKAKGDTE